MPVEFTIFPRRGLVVVRFFGFVAIDDILEATRAYISHPDYVAGQKQLVDMAGVSGFENDPVRFMQMQAGKAKRLAASGLQSIVVYIAPTEISRECSAMFVRSWKKLETVVPLVQDTEAQALALMGQPEESIAELMNASAE
ncbi:hypothetical protein IV417_06490 [Alphaproteobacteria bacterium KMM 3653]|uniref:Uncharacterized protein n=1 Tax=Harenicola maris TaxID=2841044 RepID=A0AAP2G3C4_9RHOB|nr:hypothetical protein [Harenicola maris]